MRIYVTFGLNHVHNINGTVFDKDCVAIVNGDTEEVFSIFGTKFCIAYEEKYWNTKHIDFFPRGYIEVLPEE